MSQVEPKEFSITMTGREPNLAEIGPIRVSNQGPDDALQLAITSLDPATVNLAAIRGCSLQGGQRAACPLVAATGVLTTMASFTINETALAGGGQGEVGLRLGVESSCNQGARSLRKSVKAAL